MTSRNSPTPKPLDCTPTINEVRDSDAPGPDRKTIDRDAAKRMVRQWTLDDFESLTRPETYEPPEWATEYETTAFRGPLLYPVPGDWELNDLDGGAVIWQRPPHPAFESDYWDDHDGWEPENEAVLVYESSFESDGFHPEETIISSFSVDGLDVFSVEDCPRAELLETVAEVLAIIANGEDYDNVEPPRPPDTSLSPAEKAKENGSTLGDFGGDRP